ncbi:hypothetical protein ACH41E_31870 [Streptomyces sp. NPDC020412]|uniref:hypothetical protein n=1 Tax=Streptomyces sp. NPDC020412 TaxID=3365073 RepID=UPI00379A618D
MPRGRHRHSPPLHRLLPPSAVAGASVLSAASAWFLAEPILLRTLTAVAAGAAISGAFLMRRWDRAAGRRVADLVRGRASDAWQSEERIAELESDVEESRELRGKLETKLRAKRVELAALRNEHAELLRRYAAAETGRASALEGRRQLAIEVADPKELPAVGTSPTAAAYLRAAQALDALARNVAAQRAAAEERAKEPRKAIEPAGTARAIESGKSGPGTTGSGKSEPKSGPGKTEPAKSAAVAGVAGAMAAREAVSAAPSASVPSVSSVPSASTSQGDKGPDGPGDGGGPGGGVTPEGRTAATGARPAAALTAAIVPYGPRTRPEAAKRRPEGSFDFFGHQGGGTAKAIEAAQQEDLADVVGEEALAEHAEHAEREQNFRQRPKVAAAGEVIDLTAHDDTEKLDMAGLRNALSS